MQHDITASEILPRMIFSPIYNIFNTKKQPRVLHVWLTSVAKPVQMKTSVHRGYIFETLNLHLHSSTGYPTTPW